MIRLVEIYVLVNKYLLSTYYAPGSVLRALDIVVKKSVNILSLLELLFQWDSIFFLKSALFENL